MTNEKNIFSKVYHGGEDLFDLSRDVSEALDSRFNPVISEIPKDRYDFLTGRFTITIHWEKDEEGSN